VASRGERKNGVMEKSASIYLSSNLMEEMMGEDSVFSVDSASVVRGL
jgi:hypothetical protein